MAEVTWRGHGFELVVRDDKARYGPMLRRVLAAVDEATSPPEPEEPAQLEGGAGGQFERSDSAVTGDTTTFGFS